MISVDCRREAISQPPDRADSEDFVNRGSLIGPISILFGDCQVVTISELCRIKGRLKKSSRQASNEMGEDPTVNPVSSIKAVSTHSLCRSENIPLTNRAGSRSMCDSISSTSLLELC